MMAKMAKTLMFLFLCSTNLHYIVQSAFVLNQSLKPRNPFASSEIVEGDILAIQNSNDIIFKKLGIKVQAAASINNDSNLWEDGVVPYELDSGVMKDKCLIEAAMTHIMLRSCIYFRTKQESDRDYIRIYRGDKCFATVGRYPANRVETVSLGDGCAHFGIIIHELMHVLGFHHEQNRYDRDNYLRINYENIADLKNNRNNFDVKSELRILSDFDYDSIMMYGPTDFGKDGKVTSESLVPGKVFGQRRGLSQLDIQSINALYKCKPKRNLVCTKFAQTVIHLRNCQCVTGDYFDLYLLKPMYQECKRVLKK